MKRLTILFITFCFSLGCSAQKMNSEELKIARYSWKKLAICYCLYESIPLNDSVRKKDGTLAGYLQTNEVFGLESFEKTQQFIKSYLDTVSYKSSVNTELSIMKCLDLYSSNELDMLIKEMEKEGLEKSK